MNAEATLHERSGQHLGASPWTLGQRLRQLIWELAWAGLCGWTPKPLNRWRLEILRLFGATIHGRPFVHQRARIRSPWNLELGDQACVGDRTQLYSLDRITIHSRAVVAQEAYLCTGSHDLAHPALPLITAPIVIGPGVFIGARAFILPGVVVGENAVVAATSTVTRDVEPSRVVAGNPARVLKDRPLISPI